MLSDLARSADDVLWRRTKLGLHLNATQRAAVADWCQTHWADTQASADPAKDAAWN